MNKKDRVALSEAARAHAEAYKKVAPHIVGDHLPPTQEYWSKAMISELRHRAVTQRFGWALAGIKACETEHSAVLPQQLSQALLPRSTRPTISGTYTDYLCIS